MLMDLKVKIPQEEVLKAAQEINGFKCLRKQPHFDLMDGKWRTSITCGGYGNGYGISLPCSETCKLRITDLDKCSKVETSSGYYLVQDK